MLTLTKSFPYDELYGPNGNKKKLASGIRGFIADVIKTEKIIEKKMGR